MKIALFLGAGASVPYEKPTTVQLKTRLLTKYRNNGFMSTLLDHKHFPDIEYVLSAAKEILEFSNTIGGDFITATLGGFHHSVEQCKIAHDTIEDEVFLNYSWEHKHDETLSLILTPIFDLIKNKSNDIIVFTTNYDRAIEEYCSDHIHRLRCIDGFQLSPQSGRFLWAKGDYGYLGTNTSGNDVFLYKLHGSLNWKRHKKYGIERTTYENKPDVNSNYDEDFLIYPTLSPKDEANGKEPYRTILNQFESIMKELDVCIVIGFSFRDEHINQIFTEFANTQGKKLIAISPSAITDFHTKILQQTPTNEEIETWKNLPLQSLGGVDKDRILNGDILLIQEKLKVDTVSNLAIDIKSFIETGKPQV